MAEPATWGNVGKYTFIRVLTVDYVA